MITEFEQIREAVTASPVRKKLGVVCAEDEHTLNAVFRAEKDGIVRPVLFGRRARIEPLWEQISRGENLPEIKECGTPAECVTAALQMVRAGELQCLMKGLVETGVFLKEVVNREHGIRKSRTLSAFALMQSPYYPKIFGISDMALLLAPTTEQKKAIIENAVPVFHRLGVENPVVAVLTSIEHVNPKMPDTVDAEKLKEMNEKGEITGCTVEGPISYDLAMDREAAAIKQYSSPAAGRADLLVVPDITAGNILLKALVCTGGAETCSIVCGASVPIVLTSRSAAAEDKYMSIVLAAFSGG